MSVELMAACVMCGKPATFSRLNNKEPLTVSGIRFCEFSIGGATVCDAHDTTAEDGAYPLCDACYGKVYDMVFGKDEE